MAALVKTEATGANDRAPSHPGGSGDRSALSCLVIVARNRGVHLSVPQLMHDNVLTDPHVSVSQLLKCARSAGLKAKVAHLTWDELSHLKKALPAIVTLKNGASMVLLRLVGEPDEVARRAAGSQCRRRCRACHRSRSVRGSLERRRHSHQAQL